MQMTLSEPQPTREPRDALAVYHPVGNEAPGTADKIRAQIPFRRAGMRVGTTPLACPEASALGSRSRGIEAHVLGVRRTRRTAWPAVDAGRCDRGHEPTVKPGVLCPHSAVAVLEVTVHGRIVARTGASVWRKSDLANCPSPICRRWLVDACRPSAC